MRLRGLSVFSDHIRGLNVHVHSDNTAAQYNTSKGRARTFDHTCLVHGIWTTAMELEIGLYVSRVPTKENIADDPSRERYCLLQRINAEHVEPALHARFTDPSAWDALRLQVESQVLGACVCAVQGVRVQSRPQGHPSRIA